MLIENDFELNEGGGEGPARPEAPEPTPTPPPVVVIQYRNRGVPLALIPPFLILTVVLTFAAGRRLMTAPRPGSPPPTAAKAVPRGEDGAQGAVSPPEAPADPHAALASATPPAGVPAAMGIPTLPDLPPAPTLDMVDTGLPSGPFLDALGTPPTESAESPAPEGEDATEGTPPGEADPTEPPSHAEAEATGPPPSDEPAPPVSSAEPSARPKPSREQLLKGIEREAEAKKAELRALEAWKPQLLRKDEQLAKERQALQVAEVRRVAEAGRAGFHAELRKIVAALGERSGPQINRLCEEYGRVTLPEIYNEVQVRLRRTSARLTRPAKVEMMRRIGLPEPIILDAIVRDASRSLNTRGGPRNMDEVRALAARQLLAIPPARRTRTAANPVASAAPATVPGAGRPPQ